MNQLSCEDLKKILRYNPNTGEFIWLKRLSNRIKVGEVAGSNMKNGYINISMYNKHYYAHRLAWLYMTGKWPEKQIDHINRIRHDNRWCNLREATQTQQNGNAEKPRTNTSGLRGISWHKGNNKWQVGIFINNVRKGLGWFKPDQLQQAIDTYNNAAINHFGEFAKLNRIEDASLESLKIIAENTQTGKSIRRKKKI